MTNKTNLFITTGLNADYVASMTEQATANDCRAVPLEQCGFTLIGARLVPNTFFERVQNELADTVFDYGFVLSEATVFRAEFLASLDEDECAVLMSVVMVLIERGDFALNVIEAEGEPA